MEAKVALREVPDKSSLVFVTLGELGRSEQAVAELVALGVSQADELPDVVEVDLERRHSSSRLLLQLSPALFSRATPILLAYFFRVLWWIGGISRAASKLFTCVSPIPASIIPTSQVKIENLAW